MEIIVTVKIYRGRFNQPSTIQPHHDLHWRNVIVEDRDPKSPTVRVHFTYGDVHSMEILRRHITNIGLDSNIR